MADESVQSDARTGSVSDTTLPTSPVPPSPSVDLHALFGIPRPKRPSEKSDDPGEVSESDDDETDSDEEEEDFQEGEYLVVEDNEEFMDVHVTLLAEQASVHRQILLRIFQACTPVYENWMSENEAKIPEAEAKRRREQLALYRQVLDLYGGDTEWTSLTPQQRVSRDEAGPRGIAEGQALWPASRYGHRCIDAGCSDNK
ncbi:uncharacterized protein LOC112567751 [Pomacea canaliculata]|uniref:uncharacterized protein LOC112567751 n=1 Tax=Pomacea canaliculata TaxID=400727 RepID=UPI000D72E9CA|nr:uncharacterized protein LOC112567751 [Pomacea canaliculata]